MMKRIFKKLVLTTLVLFVFLQAGSGNISLPEIFSDNIVLQQKSEVLIGGWAKTPGAVRFAWSNTATPNLFNGANLPASCFITE